MSDLTTEPDEAPEPHVAPEPDVAPEAPVEALEAPVETPDGKLVRTWPQRLAIVAGAMVSVLCFLIAGALHLVEDKASSVQRITVNGVLGPRPTTTSTAVAANATGEGAGPVQPVPSSAQNILVVGVDNADGLAADDRVRIGRGAGGLRSDTIMLVRLDPDTGLAALLSFPRDLWLPLGGDGGNDRINSALPLGGPELLIRTITDNFGITIDHFVQVDFAQFEALVDAVGGVPFPFAYPVRDDNSGLYVGEAGCVVLDGDQALNYVRSRYLQRLVDGEWEADPSADLSRIRRQQDFLRRAFARAKDQGLSNPLTANALIDAGIGAITVDQDFSAEEMLRLALRFRDLDPASLPAFALPTTPDTTAGGAAILRLRPADAQPVLDLFRGLNPWSPTAVPVSVQGPGADALEPALYTVGFVPVGDEAPTVAAPAGRSEVHFAPTERYRAELLAGWLQDPVTLVEDAELPTGFVVLTLAGPPPAVRAEPPTGTPAWTEAATASAGFLPSDDAAAC
ncbi:MAG: LCP family protein [Acidimicrobiales bacterium]